MSRTTSGTISQLTALGLDLNQLDEPVQLIIDSTRTAHTTPFHNFLPGSQNLNRQTLPLGQALTFRLCPDCLDPNLYKTNETLRHATSMLIEADTALVGRELTQSTTAAELESHISGLEADIEAFVPRAEYAAGRYPALKPCLDVLLQQLAQHHDELLATIRLPHHRNLAAMEALTHAFGPAATTLLVGPDVTFAIPGLVAVARVPSWLKTVLLAYSFGKLGRYQKFAVVLPKLLYEVIASNLPNPPIREIPQGQDLTTLIETALGLWTVFDLSDKLSNFGTAFDAASQVLTRPALIN